MRIDELARRAGTTSRTIRAYQTRGLLPPPRLVGRTGYYGEEHLTRLRIIAELQERGWSLEAIRHLLDTWARGGDLTHLLGFRALLTSPLVAEEPRRYTTAELLERFDDATAADIDRAVDAGLLRRVEEDVFEARSPLLVEAGAELHRAGVPTAAILDLVEAVRGAVGHIADRFVEVVATHVVGPLARRAADPAELEQAVARIARLRPLALEVLRPLLAWELERAIAAAVERAGEEVGRTSGTGVA